MRASEHACVRAHAVSRWQLSERPLESFVDAHCGPGTGEAPQTPAPTHLPESRLLTQWQLSLAPLRRTIWATARQGAARGQASLRPCAVEGAAHGTRAAWAGRRAWGARDSTASRRTTRGRAQAETTPGAALRRAPAAPARAFARCEEQRDGTGRASRAPPRAATGAQRGQAGEREGAVAAVTHRHAAGITAPHLPQLHWPARLCFLAHNPGPVFVS